MNKSKIIYFVIPVFFLFLVGMNQNLSAQVPVQDSLALVALYDSTNGANWTNNTNWLTGQPVSDWFGITVASERVSQIKLNLNSLDGTIPPNFDNLTNLTVLNLERNNLSGSFPQEFLNLTGLTDLNIRNNRFTGSIPNNIDTLSNLSSLYLFNNPLTGQIPAEIGNLPNLTVLRLSGTQITGPIPPEMGNLANLTLLELRQNQLTGIIPPELSNLTNLYYLALYGNQLSGEIPVELGDLVNLESLFLHANQLTGSIPTEFGNLTLMENLHLDNNNLSGTIPSEIGILTGLYFLSLNNNELSGPVPAQIANLTQLQFFILSQNQLTDLPDLSSLTSLTNLEIQNNHFTFEDIEPNIEVSSGTFIYSPQDSVGVQTDTTLDAGDSLAISVTVGGTNNEYRWTKDGTDIIGADGSLYTISSVDSSDGGSYICRITNTFATDLTLYSRPVNLTVNPVPEISAQDSLALVALYDSTDGANWTNNTNWLTGESLSTWHGITVTNYHVTSVNLSSNNLNGTIPSGIGNLTNLENLDVSQNQITGTIPVEISQLTNLYSLNLSLNNLSGSIPTEIALLTNLNYLYLNRNQLTGNIPPEIGNLEKLIILYLFSNQLTGPIPTEIGKLTNLLNLSLGSNQLSGSIPTVIGNLSNLTVLRISSNQLTGNIPAEIDSLKDLTVLDLANNALTDSIPTVIGNLTKLSQLNLGLNSLAGPIPESIGNLTALTFLNVSENSITGVIPDTIGNLTNLTAIYLGQNQLSGSIPANIGNMTNLGSLFLNDNRLTGAVPNEIVNITNLSDLGIENNQLQDLPDLSSLNNLEWLVIQNNHFTFEDIEPNIGVPKSEFRYSPQDSVGVESDTTIDAGANLTFSVTVGGTANQYQWIKDGINIAGADSSSYTISSAGSSDSGSYVCRISNSIANQLTLFSRPVNVIVLGAAGIAEQSTQIPDTYLLHQNYPNPFNPSTMINYQLPMVTQVDLSIYNILGQKVVTLVSERQQAGYYQVEWNVSALSGGTTGFASGMYILSLRGSAVKNGKKKQIYMLKKIVLLK